MTARVWTEVLSAVLGDLVRRIESLPDEVTLECDAPHLLAVATELRDHPQLGFDTLIDLCGVDYLHYGQSEWKTFSATGSGFSRGVDRRGAAEGYQPGRRFAVVSHLLSVRLNRRIRLRVFCPDADEPIVDSLVGIWAAANWFEREAFDLFGILFKGHPDLRRLLTDYGFIGHPFRKDFPLIGNVEVRYDPQRQRVVYEPVSIESRTLVPRVIRHDNRYDPALVGGPENDSKIAG
ncbi:MAG: NADH-quinone oxidoreductase subunit C [Gammaproteobacteria bacterium]|nr:NADH-quinone oxidoreductase subunit C [Gammaproteobacteria bacterium]